MQRVAESPPKKFSYDSTKELKFDSRGLPAHLFCFFLEPLSLDLELEVLWESRER